MDKAQQLFDAAVQAEESGDADRAIRLYEQSSLIDPQTPLPLLRLAFLLYEKGKWKEAIRVGRQLAKRWPRAHQAYSVIGHSYGELGRWTMAERHFRKAVTIKKEVPLLVFLGDALRCLKRTDEAEECFREALELEPDNEEVHLNLGRVYKEKDEFALAEKHLKRAIELDWNYALAYAFLGEVLARPKEDRTREAVGFLKRAVELNPDDRWSRAYLANALWTLRKLKAAEEQYRKLLELWPNDPMSYWLYGDFLACERDESTTAESYLRKAVELEPRNEFANYYMGKHLLYWDRKEEAERFLRYAARLGHPRARELLQ
jgi:tetratricopeptide (TPR) repeat protein